MIIMTYADDVSIYINSRDDFNSILTYLYKGEVTIKKLYFDKLVKIYLLFLRLNFNPESVEVDKTFLTKAEVIYIRCSGIICLPIFINIIPNIIFI